MTLLKAILKVLFGLIAFPIMLAFMLTCFPIYMLVRVAHDFAEDLLAGWRR